MVEGQLGGVEIRASSERGGSNRTWADDVVHLPWYGRSSHPSARCCKKAHVSDDSGSINLVIHHIDSPPHFYEMQLSKLMDELLTNDTITYNGVTFDLRKVIHFINKNLTG